MANLPYWLRLTPLCPLKGKGVSLSQKEYNQATRNLISPSLLAKVKKEEAERKFFKSASKYFSLNLRAKMPENAYQCPRLRSKFLKLHNQELQRPLKPYGFGRSNTEWEY